MSGTPCADAPDFARCILNHVAAEYPIARAQREIAILIALGDSNELIGTELGLKPGHVANQITKIFRAADESCRAEFQGDFLRSSLRLCARELSSIRRR